MQETISTYTLRRPLWTKTQDLSVCLPSICQRAAGVPKPSIWRGAVLETSFVTPYSLIPRIKAVLLGQIDGVSP
jgi:hypothetical protein